MHDQIKPFNEDERFCVNKLWLTRIVGREGEEIQINVCIGNI